MFLTIDTSSHYLFSGFSISAVLRMCRRHAASQPCYPRLRLCLSLCLSHFPHSLSKDAFFSPHLTSSCEKYGSCRSMPLLFETSQKHLGHPDRYLPIKTLWCGWRSQYDVRFSGSVMGSEDLRQKEWGGFRTALKSASCEIHIHKQSCKCWIGSTQLAHTKYYLYFQAPILANYLMHIFLFIYLFHLRKSCRGELVIDYLVWAATKAAKSRSFTFCCVFSSLFQCLVRSTLTYVFSSCFCTSHSHL